MLEAVDVLVERTVVVVVRLVAREVMILIVLPVVFVVGVVVRSSVDEWLAPVLVVDILRENPAIVELWLVPGCDVRFDEADPSILFEVIVECFVAEDSLIMVVLAVEIEDALLGRKVIVLLGFTEWTARLELDI